MEAPRMVRSAVLYLLLAMGANAAAAADIAALEALREGGMRKLVFEAEPAPVADVAFEDAEGRRVSLADWRGKWLVVNFWATWCAPCREEMPSLDALQREMGGESFAVVPIATGHNPLPGIAKFFAETGVTALPVYCDPRQALAREAGVLALPVTLIVDPEGREVARLLGGADWSGESARAILAALMAGS
jgi:thiol-disulfide isomerase/thioredoxin